ncbi:Bacteriorhodopsin [Methylobacterium phyllostachyos]|uniref:Bacteriorhodopsin n=1 Tax=Methylobacterium phyllostachyos TaxID=582672 RepID=A0A1H0JU09_9HYPH|nr:bacteriorhodopsin [Methylobacterium phyllostachyos]SDO47104.1 Bacteriorhodopsin [Methylobacterium phyllostachyos]
MNSNYILWATTIIMLAGGLLILATGKRRTSPEGLHTALHGIVPIIAACSYLAMATGQGLILLPTTEAAAAGAVTPTRIFYYARYIDWTFTTPLLLLSLGLTAMRHVPKRHGAIVGAILADVMMIVTAFAFGASELGWTKWTWFIVSCVAFLGVYYAIWMPQLEANAAERDDIQYTYRRNASILSVVWLGYPVILAVAPDGLNIVSDAASVLGIAILDVIAKVVYGYMSTVSDTKATDRDLAEDHPGVVPVRRAA